MIGRTIGSYQIVGSLGSGGMGEVFIGEDLMLKRQVAIKCLKPELSSRPDIVERFRSEAVTLAQLNHANIATIYTFLQEDNLFCLVMEYVRGWTLQRAIEVNSAFDPPVAIRLFQQVLDGVGAAHQHQIIHRDLKPANIMLTDTGVIKVMDFGLARALGTAHLTRAGHLMGTLEYISPEQIRGEETDTRSDIYSLGVVLYELITGRLPFVTTSEYELMNAQVQAHPPAPRAVMPSVASDLNTVILRALAKTPEQRFQSTDEFANELTHCIPASDTSVDLAPLLERLKTHTPLSEPSENVNGETRFAPPQQPESGIHSTRFAGVQSDHHGQQDVATHHASSKIWLVPSLIVGAAVAAVGLLFVLGPHLWPPDSPVPVESPKLSESKSQAEPPKPLPAPKPRESEVPPLASPQPAPPQSASSPPPESPPLASPPPTVSAHEPQVYREGSMPVPPALESEGDRIHQTKPIEEPKAEPEVVLAINALQDGREGEALQHLAKAEQIDPNIRKDPAFTRASAELEIALAIKAFKTERDGEGEKRLAKAEQIDPNIRKDPAFTRASAWLQVAFGKQAKDEERPQPARQHFEAAKSLMLSLSLASTHIENHFLLGVTHFYLYEDEQAKEFFLKVLEIDAYHYDSHYYLGKIYYDSQEWGKAEITFSRVTQSSHDRIEEVLFYLAVSQNELNKKEACTKTMSRLLDINPDHKGATSYPCN